MSVPKRGEKCDISPISNVFYIKGPNGTERWTYEMHDDTQTVESFDDNGPYDADMPSVMATDDDGNQMVLPACDWFDQLTELTPEQKLEEDMQDMLEGMDID